MNENKTKIIVAIITFIIGPILLIIVSNHFSQQEEPNNSEPPSDEVIVEKKDSGNTFPPTSYKGILIGNTEWRKENLDIVTTKSRCYQDNDDFCLEYGRLYTQEDGETACRKLKGEWRLPTINEWESLFKHFGGYQEKDDDGERIDRGDSKEAFYSLIRGGDSKINLMLGGYKESNIGRFLNEEKSGAYLSSSSYPPSVKGAPQARHIGLSPERGVVISWGGSAALRSCRCVRNK